MFVIKDKHASTLTVVSLKSGYYYGGINYVLVYNLLAQIHILVFFMIYVSLEWYVFGHFSRNYSAVSWKNMTY